MRLILERNREWCSMVTILVGEGEMPFILHQAPLARKSQYFKDVSTSEQERETDEVVVKLSSIDSVSFKVYTHWVYGSQLDSGAMGYHMLKVPQSEDFTTRGRHETTLVSKAEREATQKATLDLCSELAHYLMRLWTHADFLGDARFQNTIADELVKRLLDRNTPTVIHMKTFALVDEQTESDCPLRQICIHWADRELTKKSDMKVFSETAPKWLMSGLLFSKIRREQGRWEEDPRRVPTKRRYHVPEVVQT